MAENSKIEWTDHTFNPWIGCTKVSAGCKHCYAETQNKRYKWVDQWGVNGTRRKTSEANWRKPLAWNRKAETERKRQLVFCGSLCDVFENEPVLISWREELYELIYKTPWLTWLLLTKRPENIFGYAPHKVLKNVALGVTVESKHQLNRIEALTDNNAVFHFVSVEPMLEPFEFGEYIRWIDWVIVGGESGAGCRPFDPDWARSIYAECKDSGVPFFMKQLGGYPNKRDDIRGFPIDLRVREFPHAAAQFRDGRAERSYDDSRRTTEE